ncbi:hypothetical protein AAGG74_15390 [Bacillus mexicanus]|uniref:hypothetical protein n=1 Tax=Bacillus mexicanus TaxID=2834415 RepID=UPI003D1F5AE0
MKTYTRITNVQAFQFIEKEYRENPDQFPDVSDKAMFSELWFGKTAKDGRYYIGGLLRPPAEYVDLKEGDYIIREQSGFIYKVPKDEFERNYSILEK